VILAADIGATNARFVLVEGDRQCWRKDYRSKQFDDVTSLLARCVQDCQIPAAKLDVVLAVPGVVIEGRASLTNLNWQIDSARVVHELGVQRVHLVNDFVAAAHAAPVVATSVLHPASVHGVSYVVAGAGSGLGVALGLGNNIIRASEAGHMLFAPQTEQHYKVWQYVQSHHPVVQYEHVLSGAGLEAIHAALYNTKLSAETIYQQAQEHSIAARQSIALFVEVLADFAGNLAFAFKPDAGIYLAGGVAIKLRHFIADAFCARYLKRGRLASLVKNIPVYMVEDEDIGLQGAVMVAKSFGN
jgi:glucokinase